MAEGTSQLLRLLNLSTDPLLIFTQLLRLLRKPSSPWRIGQRQRQTRDRYLSVSELLGQRRQPSNRQQNQYDRRHTTDRTYQVQHQSVRHTTVPSVTQPHQSQPNRPDSDSTIKSHRIVRARPVLPISSSSTIETLPSSNQGQRAIHQHTDSRDVLRPEISALISDLGCSHEWQLTDNTQAYLTLPPHDQPAVHTFGSSSSFSSAVTPPHPRTGSPACTLMETLPIARYVPPPARSALADWPVSRLPSEQWFL